MSSFHTVFIEHLLSARHCQRCRRHSDKPDWQKYLPSWITWQYISNQDGKNQIILICQNPMQLTTWLCRTYCYWAMSLRSTYICCRSPCDGWPGPAASLLYVSNCRRVPHIMNEDILGHNCITHTWNPPWPFLISPRQRNGTPFCRIISFSFISNQYTNIVNNIGNQNLTLWKLLSSANCTVNK